MQILSPIASFVTAVHAESNKQISSGSPLVQLDNFDELQEISRLEKARNLTVLSLERLRGVDRQRKREILNLAQQVAEAYHVYLLEVHKHLIDRVEAGVAATLELDQVSAELVEANARTSKSRLMNLMFEDSVEQNIQTCELALAHHDSELKFAARKLSETAIVSPFDGILELHVGVGSFVNVGSVIAIVR